MSSELIAILVVGVALGGIVLQGLHGLNRRMDGLDEWLRAVEAGQEEIKGQLTMVRDYIAGRNMRPADPLATPAE